MLFNSFVFLCVFLPVTYVVFRALHTALDGISRDGLGRDHTHQSLGITVWQWAQEGRVDDREDRGDGAGGEREEDD